MPYGVSNSFKRGIIKTYARPAFRREEGDFVAPPYKRRRLSHGSSHKHEIATDNGDMRRPSSSSSPSASSRKKEAERPQSAGSSNAPSSSPGPDSLPIFSSDPPEDEESELSTPPSSPVEPFSPPKHRPHKPAFSVLKRKQTTQVQSDISSPLSEISTNVRALPPIFKTKAQKTQMQIDLGGEVRKTCRTCGMEYMPSLKEDATLHKAFCEMDATGIDLGKACLRDDSLRHIQPRTKRSSGTQEMVMVDRKSSPSLRSKVTSILRVVNADLCAPEVTEETLWHQPAQSDADSSRSVTRRSQQSPAEPTIDRFKALIALDGERCVGFCLVEKIKQAFPVIATKDMHTSPSSEKVGTKTSSISHSHSAELALLGISRIWVSKAFRAKGIGQALLDAAQNSYFYGISIPKNLIAFSQPTESGRQLAVRWFGHEIGWHVYIGLI